MGRNNEQENDKLRGNSYKLAFAVWRKRDV